jgi:hypothetical protein
MFGNFRSLFGRLLRAKFNGLRLDQITCDPKCGPYLSTTCTLTCTGSVQCLVFGSVRSCSVRYEREIQQNAPSQGGFHSVLLPTI